MKLWLIIPVKPFEEGKTRLVGALPDANRAELSQKLFQHVVRQAMATSVLAGIIVVSRDATVLCGLQSPNLHFLDETGFELNAALLQGRQMAMRHDADAILILPADLPFLTTADIETIYKKGKAAPGIVIVPSTDNGTNALLVRPPAAIDFSFGWNSFTHHCHAAEATGISCTTHASTTLAFDIDNPADLDRFTAELSRSFYSNADFPQAAR